MKSNFAHGFSHFSQLQFQSKQQYFFYAKTVRTYEQLVNNCQKKLLSWTINVVVDLNASVILLSAYRSVQHCCIQTFLTDIFVNPSCLMCVILRSAKARLFYQTRSGKSIDFPPVYSSTTGLLVRVDSRCFYLSVSTCCCYSPVSTDNRKLIEYPRKFTPSLQVFSSVSTIDFRSSVCRWSSRSASVSTCLHHLDQLPSQRVFNFSCGVSNHLRSVTYAECNT